MCRDIISSRTVQYIKTNKKADEVDIEEDDLMVCCTYISTVDIDHVYTYMYMCVCVYMHMCVCVYMHLWLYRNSIQLK